MSTDTGKDTVDTLGESATEAKKAPHNKKRVVLIGLIAVLVIGIVAGVFLYMGERKRAERYQMAQTAYDAGAYIEAAQIFGELGTYKNSAEMVTQCLDANSLNGLQQVYKALSTVYKTDTTVLTKVDEVIAVVKALDGATYLSLWPDNAVVCLYQGRGYEISRSCSLWDAANIKAAIPSAQIYNGGGYGYTLKIEVFSDQKAKSFRETLDGADEIMAAIDGMLLEVGTPSKKYQEAYNKLLDAYHAVEDFHTFTRKVPDAFKSYTKENVAQKRAPVDQLLGEVADLNPEIVN